jgi:hypothetical protein
MPGPDLNTYALSMQLSIDQDVALKAVSAVIGKVATLEKQVAQIGQKLIDALDLSDRQIVLPEIPIQEIPVSVQLPKMDALKLRVEPSIIAESKKALDDKLRTNITNVVSAAVAAGFRMTEVPPIKAKAEAEIAPEIGAYGMALPKMEAEVEPTVDPDKLQPIRYSGDVSVLLDKASKKALDNALLENITRTVGFGIAMGVKEGGAEAVSGAKLGIDETLASIYEKIAEIRGMKFELLHAKDAEAFARSLEKVNVLFQEISVSSKIGGDLVPRRVFDDLAKARAEIFVGMKEDLDRYMSDFATTASDMMDFETGRLRRSSENIAYYQKQGQILEKQVLTYQKLEVAGKELTESEKDVYKFMLKELEAYKKKKDFLQDELETAKKLEAHQKRMGDLGENLVKIGQEGYMSWLFIDIVTGGERLKTVLGAIRKGLGGIFEVGRSIVKSLSAGFVRLSGLLKGIFRKEDIAKMADATKGLGSIVAPPGVEGQTKGFWNRIKNIFRSGSKDTEAATKGMAISPPAADPAGGKIKTWLTNVGEGLRSFMASMGAISPVAILKFALLGVVLLGLLAGLILLASWLAKLGTQGVVALLAITMAAIGLAFAMKLLTPALVELGTVGSVAIPIILSLAATVATLALVVYAATAFVNAITALFSVFKDNIGAGFAFVGFIAALGVAMAVAGAGFLAFAGMFFLAMGILAAAVAIGAGMLLPAMWFTVAMGFVAAGIAVVAGAVWLLAKAMGQFADATTTLSTGLMAIPAAVAGFTDAMSTLIGSVWTFAMQMIPLSFAMGFIVRSLKSFAEGIAEAMVSMFTASVLGAPGLAFLGALSDTMDKLGDALTKMGTDAGEKLSDIAFGLRDLATVRLGPELMTGLVLAAVGLGAIGDAAATAAPQMQAVADAGTAITEMVDKILDKAPDFEEAANIIEQFQKSIGAPAVGAAGLAGPLGTVGPAGGMLQGLLAKVRGEPISPVKTVADEAQKKSAERGRQMNEILAAIKTVMENVSGKLDPTTLLAIKALLDTHLPRIAEGGTGAPVDEINRWK